MSKSFEGRKRSVKEWQPPRLRLDEDLVIRRQRVSLVEELGLVAARLGLGAAVVFLI